jgi:hypothetical protein
VLGGFRIRCPSFEFSLSRFACAVSASWWRGELGRWSWGEDVFAEAVEGGRETAGEVKCRGGGGRL